MSAAHASASTTRGGVLGDAESGDRGASRPELVEPGERGREVGLVEDLEAGRSVPAVDGEHDAGHPFVLAAVAVIVPVRRHASEQRPSVTRATTTDRRRRRRLASRRGSGWLRGTSSPIALAEAGPAPTIAGSKSAAMQVASRIVVASMHRRANAPTTRANVLMRRRPPPARYRASSSASAAARSSSSNQVTERDPEVRRRARRPTGARSRHPPGVRPVVRCSASRSPRTAIGGRRRDRGSPGRASSRSSPRSRHRRRSASATSDAPVVELEANRSRGLRAARASVPMKPVSRPTTRVAVFSHRAYGSSCGPAATGAGGSGRRSGPARRAVTASRSAGTVAPFAS